MTTTARRRTTALAAGLLSAALVLVLGACGGGGDSGAGSGGDAAGGSAAGYPVTIDTQYGALTLKEKPERIVVIGAPTDVDILAALHEPADVFGFFAGEDESLAQAPWLAGRYGTYDAKLIADAKPAREAIAAQHPDLIVYFGAGAPLDRQGYRQLADIAPTYAYRQVPSWRQEVATIGKLVGRSGEAVRVTRGMADAFAKARKRIPGLQGKTFFHGVAGPQGLYSVPAAAQLFQALGMKAAANQPVAPAGPRFLSPENLDQVTADVVFLGGEGEPRAALQKDPRFAQLPAVKNHTMVFLHPLLGNVQIPSQIGPASVPWMLNRLVPELEKSALSSGS